MDIRPPKKPQSVPSQLPPVQPARPSQDIHAADIVAESHHNFGDFSRRKRQTLWISMVGIAVFIVGVMASMLVWYGWALSPPSNDKSQIRLIVKSGETAAMIADRLKDAGLIRSELAFHIYTELTGTRTKLQAGGYVLSRNQSLSSIVDHITTGKTDVFDLTISPGLTLQGLREQFANYGYSDAEINEAFSAQYKHPLLASKPASATLEGYIYPETYNVGVEQPLSSLLVRSFNELYQLITEKKYLDQYTQRGLTIHEAITLASIVQKEVSGPVDQKQVAQVFLSRIDQGIMLGSDVTFIYAAKQLGVTPTVDIDSPYNTRRYSGLPPGPIANMNPSALEAIAFPASGDFLYFVAGDDGKTYFSRTEDEHNANVAKHCKKLCN